MKKRTYYGSMIDSSNEFIKTEDGTFATGLFCITGEMADGSKVYERVDKEDSRQWLRTTRHGMQIFYTI